jgi:dTDP-4-dehydrorhamnose 3,5-epimerase
MVSGGTPVNSRIDGVVVTPLARIADERGTVLHMLRADDPHFIGFGEVYFSTVYPDAIKGWHIHREMTLNYAVPVGRIKLVLYDDRLGSATRGVLEEHFVGADDYVLVTVPPMVWNGFKGIGTETALVANCATLPHDPSEIDRMDPFDPSIPYDWGLRHQ